MRYLQAGGGMEGQPIIPANMLAQYHGSGPIQLWQFLLEVTITLHVLSY